MYCGLVKWALVAVPDLSGLRQCCIDGHQHEIYVQRLVQPPIT